MKIRIAIISVLLLFIWGCSHKSDNNPVTPTSSSGNVFLKIDKQNAPASVLSVNATLTREGFTTLTANLSLVSDTSAQVTFENINAGIWHLRVDALDSAEIVLFTGETDVNVLSGMITQVNLQLQSTGAGFGSLQIIVGWGGTPGQTSVWKKQNVNVVCDFRGVFFIDQNRGWAIGNNGIVVRTTNSGANWSSQYINSSQTLNAITFSDNSNGWIVGSNKSLFKSNDGGQSWTQITTTGFNIHYRDICFINSAIGIIAGDYGTILVTTNGGNNWTDRSIYYSVDLYDVTIKDEGTIVATGQQGIVAISSDLGLSWSYSANYGSPVWMQAIQFPAPGQVGFAVGGEGVLIKSVNSGTTWVQVTSGTTQHLEDLFFTDANNGRFVGNNGLIRKTTNGGMTWTTESTNTNAWLNAIYFPAPNVGWAVGQGSTILKYSN